MALGRRGGVAHGDASLNPTATTYGNIPPSSTYRGPKVAGTYQGFVGVFVGVGVFIMAVVIVLVFLRWRQLRRERTTRSFEDSEAFEMPRSWTQHSRTSLDSSPMSPMYRNVGATESAFFDPDRKPQTPLDRGSPNFRDY
ncbi:hypothetical protein OIV83_001312 [Microbotryomycetes sp. JL201]|nr:hypothetical protein OIV83_001312 [Microbotryomycetes sp. JL201]